MSLIPAYIEFRKLFDSMQIPMALLDSGGCILDHNFHLSRLLELNASEIQGKPLAEFLQGSDLENGFDSLKGRFDQGVFKPLEVSFRNRPEVSYLLNLCYSQNQDIFVAPLSNSSPEAQKAEVKKLTEKLERLEADMEDMVYAIGHDLRAPMRAILGFAQILEENYAGKLDSEGDEILGIIKDNTRKLNAYIMDLVDYSSIQKQEIYEIEVDLPYLFTQEFEKQVKENYPEKKVSFKADEIPPVKSDSNLLSHVARQLISNALKFSDNAEEAQIYLGVAEGEEGKTYFLRDNGIGFDPKYKERAFGFFQRMVGEDRYVGNGIGLSIVKKAIQLLEGRVWAESQPGMGSTFYFTLS